MRLKVLMYEYWCMRLKVLVYEGRGTLRTGIRPRGLRREPREREREREPTGIRPTSVARELLRLKASYTSLRPHFFLVGFFFYWLVTFFSSWGIQSLV